MSRKKITVVGAGNVGASLAQALALTNLAHVVLIDIPETGGMPAGKALDIAEAGPVYGYDTRLTGGTDWALASGSDIIVVTAGIPRKPGMSRDDLLLTNARIVGDVAKKIKQHAANALVIVVSNPLDAMCTVMQRVTGFPRQRVIGMAGVLDSARMRTFIAEALKVSVENVHAFVLGGHGDTMVPLPRYSTVSGIPITELLPADKVEAIMQRTRDGGAEIVKLLEKGSAYYAPAASVCEMVEAIILDKKKILPCAVQLDGEYGVKGFFVGVPVKLGATGMEEVVTIKLSGDDEKAFQKSVQAVKELVAVLDRNPVSA
ncbi:MAG: malate dehydrogenase [Elusimicrobia bacterium]|nr:malate dehydrogenase [Elusimicrobiota bacterium]